LQQAAALHNHKLHGIGYMILHLLQHKRQKVVQLFDSSYSVFGVIQNYYKIVHLSQLGDTLWTKTMNKNLFLRCFIKTNDGGYAMLGFINDWQLIKTDSMGDTLWSKPYPQLSDPVV
jgi:hypothetical protein